MLIKKNTITINENNKKDKRIKFLTANEIREIISICNPFYNMLFSILFESGARISEVLSSKINDIDFSDNKMILTNLKKKKSIENKVVYISDNTCKKVLQYINLKSLQKSDFLFCKKSKQKAIDRTAVNKYMRNLFIKYFPETDLSLAHPHIFRHSRAIDLLQTGGIDIKTVQQILGHSSLANTMIYLKYSNPNIKEAMSKASWI